MGALDGYYLYCDLDGTLFNDEKRVSREDRAAIRSFVRAGGRFGVATGRVPSILGPVADDLPVSAPLILGNGAGLYDLAEKKYLAMHPIDPVRTRRVVSRAMTLNRSACLQIFTDDRIYEPNPDQLDDPQTVNERTNPLHTSIDLVPPPYMKLLIALASSELDVLQSELEREGLFEGFSVFRSSDIYLEFVSAGVNKGAALADVRAYCGDVKKILAIGDYNNDIDMVSQADIGGAPANAIDKVKSVADIVLKEDNNHSCVARFLETAL